MSKAIADAFDNDLDKRQRVRLGVMRTWRKPGYRERVSGAVARAWADPEKRARMLGMRGEAE